MTSRKPLYKLMAGVFGIYILMLVFHSLVFGWTAVSGWGSIKWFFIGAFYTHCFEYFHHRVPMHRGIKYLEALKDGHTKHHQVFAGKNFKRLFVEDSTTLISRWYVFPILFTAHYALAALILPQWFVPAFFLGVVTNYAVFELCHWFTHLSDNYFDQVINRIPLLRTVRKQQIEHHRLHHLFPVVRFNFTPPYLGDRIFRTMDPKRFIRKINNPD